MVNEETTAYCIPGGEGLLALGYRFGASYAHAQARRGTIASMLHGDGEPLAREATRFHIWAQTPPAVWAAYRDAGYSWGEMMREEMSYL